jgi:predicted AAA+ superfamily ATPase
MLLIKHSFNKGFLPDRNDETRIEMLSQEAQNRIRQFNPWLVYPERAHSFITPFIPANFIHRRIENIGVRENFAVLAVGPRQAGKSTVVWYLLKPLAPNILFLNMEDPLLRSECTSAVDIVEFLRNNLPSIKAIFIDEAQHMNDAGLFIKGLVDSKLGLYIWVTGSSSFHLRSKTRESLAGRAARERLLPLSYNEIMMHSSPPNITVVGLKHIAGQISEHMCIFGGYPAVYLAEGANEKISLLTNLVEALILRDASDMFRITRVDAFRRLLALLSRQVGDIVNFSELAGICGVDAGTIRSYVEIMEESHVLKVVQPFAGGKRREITNAPKIFFIDNGIRNELVGDFSFNVRARQDGGKILENWTFTEIYKHMPLQGSLHYWRSKAGAEVDFVVEQAGKIFAVEVKSAALEHPRPGKSLLSFIDAYKPKRVAFLNASLVQTIKIENSPVDFITPEDVSKWLAENII